MIELSIHKKLGNKLLNLDFQITKGEFLGVIGPSGSGKTTLLRILAGLTNFDEGKLMVNGLLWNKNTKIITKPQQRKGAFVFQDFALFPNMTVGENLNFANDVIDEKLKEYFIKELKIHVNKYPKHLSGGEKQRVAIVRALLSKPDFLLLDEPFSALDKKLKNRVAELLAEYHHKQKCTVVLVSHDEELVGKIADNILEFSENSAPRFQRPLRFEKNAIQGVVLAGGQSSRMGTDKGFLKIGEDTFTETLIHKIERVTNHQAVLSANSAKYGEFGRKVISDNFSGKGPLAGLEAVMKRKSADYYLMVSCDSPLVSEELLNQLIQKAKEIKQTVWVKSNGKIHPLIAVYHQSLYSDILNRVSKNELRIQDLLDTKQVSFLEMKSSDELINFNTKEDYQFIKNQ
jgi:molybdate transport system ATP-binding protein